VNQDALVIARSILELKQNGDTLKDYIFPFFIAFFSALLGAGVAYFFNRRQERFRVERERFDLANKLMSDVLSGLNTLVSIKSNYIGMTQTGPFERAFEVPIIMLNERGLEIDISKYYFIGSIQTCNFPLWQKIVRWINREVIRTEINKPSAEDIGKTWRNLMRLVACINNYNYIMTAVAKRNEIDKDIKHDIQHACRQLNANPREVSKEFVLRHVDGAKLIPYIHLTEFVISLLDHVLKEMDSFILEFPEIAESNIEMKMIGSRAKVVRVFNDKPAYLASLIPVIHPNFEVLSGILGMDLEATTRTYTFSNWY
jgi:hypothetical protein